MNYGFIKSKLDGSEHILEVKENIELPKEYSYVDYMPPVLNQGSMPICVTCACSAVINWRMNLKDGESKDNGVKLMEIYRAKKSVGDGMTFKEALHFLRHEGVTTREGNKKIDEYSLVKDANTLKYALVMNGPCIAGLPVYNAVSTKFWIGRRLQGGHAIAIVGYDKDGFIIRNSWGTKYGDNGYAHVPYKDYNKFMEIWTVV